MTAITQAAVKKNPPTTPIMFHLLATIDRRWASSWSPLAHAESDCVCVCVRVRACIRAHGCVCVCVGVHVYVYLDAHDQCKETKQKAAKQHVESGENNVIWRLYDHSHTMHRTRLYNRMYNSSCTLSIPWSWRLVGGGTIATTSYRGE